MTRSSVFVLLSAICAGAALAAQSSSGQPSNPAAAPAAPRPAGQAAAQAPPVQPTPGIPPVIFRVEVNYVEVDALVTDRNGNLVRNLTKEDFQILEDGRPQKVELFTIVDVPIERADRVIPDRPPLEPDVRINDRFEGRMFAIVLDDLHTNFARTPLVRKAARLFIERHLGANDLAAVVFTSGRANDAQEFTSNKRLLLSAVDRFSGQKLRSRTLNRLDEYNRQRMTSFGGTAPTRASVVDPEDQERAYKARSSMDTVKSVARYLEGVRGRRKAILLLSEGIDYDITNVFENREATTVFDAVRDAVGGATRSNVAIYAIDPRGLTSLADESMELTNLPDDPSIGIGVTSLLDELRISQDNLKWLGEETGGFAVINTNEFRTGFDRVIRDNSTYYVLGYYPQNQKRDGRFRRIEVRTTRPGLEVRARKGYMAPKGKAEPRALDNVAVASASAVLREALDSPIPEPGLPMAVQAAAFRAAGAKASVAVITQFGGQNLAFTEQNGEFRGKIEVSMIAVDTQGKIRAGDRNTVDLNLRPQTHQAVLAGGFRVLHRLELAPGRYQLRVAAKEAGGLVGSVLYDLEVPDFAGEPFSMSGLVVTSTAAGMTPTARPDEQLEDVLPGPPTIVRDFLQGDTMALFAEVYDNEVAKPHRVDITASILTEDARVVYKTEDVRSSDELKGARGGYGYAVQIPLKDIAAGRYVLRVEARSRLESDKPVVRETEIRVHEPRRPVAPAPATPPPAQGKVIVPVDRGPVSGISDYREVVARTPEEWESLWKSLPARRPMPKVSFQNTMIAALFVGDRPTAGFSVEFVSVKLDGDVLVIEYTEKSPGPDMTAGQMLTTPYVVAGVPLHAGPVRFVKVSPAGQP
jgi:VWFA-related protein